jgi:hypothetical protein
MKINHCLRCEHQWASKLDKPRTCSKCRSPYWDVPRGSKADFEKKSAASPIPKEWEDIHIPQAVAVPLAPPANHHDNVRKKLDPNYVPPNRETIEELRARIAAVPAKKPIVSSYNNPPVVEDQPDAYTEPTTHWD